MSEQQKILDEKNLKNHSLERSETQDKNVILKIKIDKLKK